VSRSLIETRLCKLTVDLCGTNMPRNHQHHNLSFLYVVQRSTYKTLFPSVILTPTGPSCKHIPFQLSLGIDPVTPTQRPEVSTPVVILTFSSRVREAMNDFALETADDQEGGASRGL
jgi:hypothetical protein